jgi:hypothetical protein
MKNKLLPRARFLFLVACLVAACEGCSQPSLGAADEAALRAFEMKATGSEIASDLKVIPLQGGDFEVDFGSTSCLIDSKQHIVLSWMGGADVTGDQAKPLSETEAIRKAKEWLSKVGVEFGGDITATLSNMAWVVHFGEKVNGFDSPLIMNVGMNRATGKVWSYDRLGFDFSADDPNIKIEIDRACQIVAAKYLKLFKVGPSNVSFRKTLYSYGGPSRFDGRDSRPLFDAHRMRLGHQIRFEGSAGNGYAIVDAETGEMLADDLEKSIPSSKSPARGVSHPKASQALPHADLSSRGESSATASGTANWFLPALGVTGLVVGGLLWFRLRRR